MRPLQWSLHIPWLASFQSVPAAGCAVLELALPHEQHWHRGQHWRFRHRSDMPAGEYAQSIPAVPR